MKREKIERRCWDFGYAQKIWSIKIYGSIKKKKKNIGICAWQKKLKKYRNTWKNV